MNKLTEAAVNTGVTKDLMSKVNEDVKAALNRVLNIAPEPHLPIALSAGASVLALVAILLDSDPKPTPDPECLLLAGILMARTGMGGDDPVGDAFSDFETLRAAGRLAISGKADSEVTQTTKL